MTEEGLDASPRVRFFQLFRRDPPSSQAGALELIKTYNQFLLSRAPLDGEDAGVGPDGQNRPPALPGGRGGRYPGPLTEPPTVLVVVLRKAGIGNGVRRRSLK